MRSFAFPSLDMGAEEGMMPNGNSANERYG
jgi:hypothetical protein